MKPEHYERKEQVVCSLPPTVAKWLREYGDGNPSLAVLELVRHVTDVDALYPKDLKEHYGLYRSPLRESHEQRKAYADQVANWSGNPTAPPAAGPAVPRTYGRARRPRETATERFERIRNNTLIAARAQSSAQSELQQEEEIRQLAALEHQAFIASEAAYRAGKPLPEHTELMTDKATRAVRERVLQKCQDTFGWRSGPRPASVADDFFEQPSPTPSATPPRPPSDDEQIEAGYQQWLAEQRQEATGGAGGSEGTAPEPPPNQEPESIVERDVAQGPMDQETTAPATAAASTAGVTGTEPPAPIAGNLPGEPTF